MGGSSAWWMKLSFSLLVLAWRLRSLLSDGSRLKKLCVGWVGSPAMQSLSFDFVDVNAVKFKYSVGIEEQIYIHFATTHLCGQV